MRGAYCDISLRGVGEHLVHLVEDVHPAARACSSASRMMSALMFGTLMSICSAVMPSRVPATLKSMSP